MNKDYTFTGCLQRVLKHEGGYVNHKDDKGGETNYGITKATAIAYGYTGSMKTIPMSVVESIYKKGFWDKCKCDTLYKIHPLLADHFFDLAVNAGTGRPIKHLQEALNLLNNKQVDYKDTGVDGVLGQGTLNSLNAYVRKRGQDGLHRLILTLVSMQIEHYLNLTRKNPSQESFTNGWLDRATKKMRTYVLYLEGK